MANATLTFMDIGRNGHLKAIVEKMEGLMYTGGNGLAKNQPAIQKGFMMEKLRGNGMTFKAEELRIHLKATIAIMTSLVFNQSLEQEKKHLKDMF